MSNNSVIFVYFYGIYLYIKYKTGVLKSIKTSRDLIGIQYGKQKYELLRLLYPLTKVVIRDKNSYTGINPINLSCLAKGKKKFIDIINTELE